MLMFRYEFKKLKRRWALRYGRQETQKSTNWLSCKTLILLLIFTNQISSTKSNSYIIKNVNEEQAFEYNLQRVHVYIV